MAQVLPIDPVVFEEARKLASTSDPVAFAPCIVAVVQPEVQPSFLSSASRQPMPAWYLTPIVVIPLAAAAFIVGNVLMMIPWSVF